MRSKCACQETTLTKRIRVRAEFPNRVSDDACAPGAVVLLIGRAPRSLWQCV
jgi:hypothetical protein